MQPPRPQFWWTSTEVLEYTELHIGSAESAMACAISAPPFTFFRHMRTTVLFVCENRELGIPSVSYTQQDSPINVADRNIEELRGLLVSGCG
jgi:hypothetical protein